MRTTGGLVGGEIFTGHEIVTNLLDASAGETSCVFRDQRRCRENWQQFVNAALPFGASSSGAGGGAPIMPIFLPPSWVTGSELTADQTKSAQNAIDIIRCTGWTSIADLLQTELNEGDIEIMDQDKKVGGFTVEGITDVPPCGIPGEWIYIRGSVFNPGSGSSVSYMQPCNSRIVNLVSLLLHESMHAFNDFGGDDAGEIAACERTIEFLDDMEANLIKCFGDCTHADKINILQEIATSRSKQKNYKQYIIDNPDSR